VTTGVPNERESSRGGRKHSGPEVLRRRFELARLYFREGVTYDQLAARFGIRKSQVFEDLAWVQKHWRDCLGPDKLDALKVEILQELDMIQAEAKRGWRRSLKPASRMRERTVQPRGGGPQRETTRSVERQAGDPRFLAELRAAWKDVRDLLGLDAPRGVVVADEPLPVIRMVNVYRASPAPNGDAP
jgi:hypothetical protein